MCRTTDQHEGHWVEVVVQREGFQYTKLVISANSTPSLPIGWGDPNE
jgi:hypothetical protein